MSPYGSMAASGLTAFDVAELIAVVVNALFKLNLFFIESKKLVDVEKIDAGVVLDVVRKPVFNKRSYSALFRSSWSRSCFCIASCWRFK